VWAESYDRQLDDLFAVQDEITRDIVTAMDIKLVSGESARTVRQSLRNPAALEKYYRGWQALFGSTREGINKARQMFEETILLEPGSSLGYALAAWAHWWSVFRGLSDNVSYSLQRATELAQQALGLDDVTGLPHLMMAQIYLLQHDHSKAIAEAELAVLARPSCDGSYAAKAYILNYLGRPAEAIELAKYAMRLTPVYPIFYPAESVSGWRKNARSVRMPKLMPIIFFGHGNPMNALLDNEYSRGWAATGAGLPRPKAVLAISAHWYIPATWVTAMPDPQTIHDFGGFPPELYRIQYPAPGDPQLAGRIRELLSPLTVRPDENWGLDHGTWSVLCHVFPGADIPVVQLSIDKTQPADFHYQIAKRLAPLRDEGVLIIGSGNLVHNLHAYAWGRRDVQPLDCALRFEKKMRELLLAQDDAPLIDYESLGPDAMLAAPTPDHYLPLLYVIALRQNGDQVRFPVEGFDGGSVSMLTVTIDGAGSL